MSKLPAIEVRPIGLDSLAELRHIHSRSYRSYLCCDLSQDQLDALLEYVATPAYLDLVLQTECLGAWIDARLCATGSWTLGGGSALGARIASVCVDPLFSRLGLGRRIVGEMEARARRAGCALISARAPLSSATFFERIGYAGTSRGVWSTPCGVSVPVLHMRKGEMRPIAMDAQILVATVIAAKHPAASRLH